MQEIPFDCDFLTGGQTGVDRAALDVALALGLSISGWCPGGRRAEDGVIGEHYPLRETATSLYEIRTEWNVRDAAATLILSLGSPTDGTDLTYDMAVKHRKPCLYVDLEQEVDVEALRDWIHDPANRPLNIAGPRESSCPGVYLIAKELLFRILAP